MMPPRLSERESRALAKHIVQELFVQLSDDDNVALIANKWGKYLDQWLGKNFRRFLVLVFIGLSVFLGLKFEVWSKFLR